MPNSEASTGVVPIGIVTKDRVVYLDATLRSLSATDLPKNVPVTVFDDASATPQAKNYYSTNKVVQVKSHWPKSAEWKKAGLDIVTKPQVSPKGIKGKVTVHTLGKTSLGVVSASCRAIQLMFQAHPDAPGIILLQDDVVFNHDWYTRLVTTAQDASLYQKPLGLLAGIKINHSFKARQKKQKVLGSGITAQCLYISRACFTALKTGYLGKTHKTKQRFDDTFRQAIVKAGFWAGCIFPFVCQHIGIKSLVRPGRRWFSRTKGRIGYYAHPPYVIQETVKSFSK